MRVSFITLKSLKFVIIEFGVVVPWEQIRMLLYKDGTKIYGNRHFHERNYELGPCTYLRF